jgi:protein Mpv17
MSNTEPVIFGPAATKWYGLLTKHVNFKSTNGTIVARVACDQLLFAPVNMGTSISPFRYPISPHHKPLTPKPSIGLFLSSMAYLEGSSVKQRLNDAYVPGLTKNFMVWPWVQFTNFKYVPMEHRVLVVNIISLGWNCYLSFLNSGGGKLPNLPPGHTKEGGELPPS